MRTRKDKYTEIIGAVVILFVRDSTVLLGLKTNGPVAGWVMPPGGHIEKDDQGPISAGHREGFEETNLKALSSGKVAELHIEFPEQKRKVLVHVTLCKSWTGRLRNKKGSGFEWLRFIPFSEIPWEDMPTREDTWMNKVLREHKKCIVWITCGKDRKDVIRVTTRTVESLYNE